MFPCDVSEIASCEADITFFAERHHPDTRKWFFDDFYRWFENPGESRAYVLLGDAGVGKSVMAGVLAKKSAAKGNLAAAYFCREKDDTRNNPRYLLGTIACQLCKCNAQYSNFVGGEGGIRKLLGNSEIGIQGLFTKFLEEPLTKCSIPCERKLIVIDALDETKYESREDFLDIIKRRFPMLPEWLVFFITSRPVDAVQFRFKNYNPCIKICAGNSENLEVYRQHEQDIKLFLEKSVDFSLFPYSADDVVEKCKGMFLCAFHIVKDLNAVALSGEIVQLDDVFQGDVQDYFLQNVSRVFQKVGESLYKKLFGCAIVAPSSLPTAFVAFILQRENSNLKECKVIDALSTFFDFRESNDFDKSFDFRHNLIPELLTEKESSRELFIDRDEAGEYFRDVVVEILSAAIEHQQWEKPSVMKVLLDYFVSVGVRFLCGYQDRDSLNVVFNCLTCYQFLRKRIKRKGSEIYAVIADLKLSVGCHVLSEEQKEDLQEIRLALESNIHVLLEVQHLLHCCFRNTSHPVQEKLKIPAGVSNIGMECSRFPYLSCKILNDAHCFALSPDNKFLAAGGRDSLLYILDACTLEKVQEPVVLERIDHLEFRPDGEFLFFGWLSKMFSLQQGCVRELPQFAHNNHYYVWGSFIFDGQYVVVNSRSPASMPLCLFSSIEILCLWAAHEIQQMDSFEVDSLIELLDHEGLRRNFELMMEMGVEKFLHYEVLGLENARLRRLSFEQRYQETSTQLVRQRVINLYADIFPTQVWNVETGRPFLEEAFSADVQLNPFFYLCHLITWVSNLEMRGNLHGWNQRFSLSVIASLNAFFLLEEWKGRCHDLGEPRVSLQGEFLSPLPLEPYLIMHAPKFQNSPFITRSKITLDRKWIAVKPDLNNEKCNLFERVSDCEDFNFQNPIYVVVEVNQFAFTDDSRIFLYITTNKSLEALILKTGSILSSFSGLIPLHLEPGNQAGFFFRANQMERIILIKDFPTSLLRFLLFSYEAKQIEMAFFSFNNQVFLENISVLLKQTKTADSDMVSCQSSLVKHATKYIFCSSALGEKLLAKERGDVILFFGDKATPVLVRAADHECRVTFLTFSVDGASLLFCTQMADSYPCFFVWDVHKKVLMASFDSPLGFQPVHCWCFSRDEKKLIICGAFQISIFEYDKQPLCSFLTLEPPGPFREFDKFTHCTVSSDNEALACCIADRILVHALNTPKEPSLMELPRGHFGRIEFCQFLKGRRYLISYGVDCTVLLWDLGEWKAAAYTIVAQGRESILGMAVCPSEDRVVCLTAFGRFIVIDLFGLVNDKPKEFPTSMSAGKEMTSARSFGRFDRLKDPMTLKNSGQSSNDSKPINWTEYFEEMNIMADENMESEDDLNEDH